MRRLGIDARKLADFGIGTYLEGLLAALAEFDPPGGLVVLVTAEGRHLLPDLPAEWRILEVEAAGYSVKEQLAVPWSALRAGVRVLHVPHYVIPLLWPGRLVVTVHDIIHVLFPEFLPNRLGFAYARAMIRAAIRRGRWVVAASQTTAQDLRRFFGASEHRLRVIPNGVLPVFTQPGKPEDDAAIRGRLGVEGPYLLHVGNHKPHKNAEGVLKSYQMLVHEHSDAVPPLLFVGGFPADGTLARRARAMSMGPRVRCLGHVERKELAALYRGAQAFVYPTLYEGFGLPVLEAMACGAPVVAGDVAAVREVAGDAVLRVNPRDTVALAAALRRVIEQGDLRAQLAERGRRRAAGYDWKSAASATLALYQAVQREG
jgi:glycosyltransferase involved in cell wall biosynthesis